MREEVVSLSAPADVQIARLEAEAARKMELRAAKSKQNARQQAPQVSLLSGLRQIVRVKRGG